MKTPEEQRQHDEFQRAGHEGAYHALAEYEREQAKKAERAKRTPVAFWLFLAALVLAPTVLWYFKHRA